MKCQSDGIKRRMGVVPQNIILFEEHLLLDVKTPSPALLEQIKAVNGV